MTFDAFKPVWPSRAVHPTSIQLQLQPVLSHTTTMDHAHTMSTAVPLATQVAGHPGVLSDATGSLVIKVLLATSPSLPLACNSANLIIHRPQHLEKSHSINI